MELTPNDIKQLQYLRECLKVGLVNVPQIDGFLEKVQMQYAAPKPRIKKRTKEVAEIMAKLKITRIPT